MIVFYEQASSHTLWLKAFPCKPSKPCMFASSFPATNHGTAARD
jgi:hypothetical protein